MTWVNDEPALFVSYCLTHTLHGPGMVDGSRTETADRVARYQTDCHRVERSARHA